MTSSNLRWLFVFLLFLGTPFSTASSSVLVYYENGSQSASSMHARFREFSQVAFDTYLVNSTGAVSGKTYGDDIAFARSNGLSTFAVVSNFSGDDFNSTICRSVLHSSDHVQTFISGLTETLSRGKYNGINIDFESVPPRDRVAFTSFIKEVSEKMHANNYLVILSVPAEQQDDPTDDWSGAFDLKALGKLVDEVQIMTYDENGPWGRPGPVAGFDWVQKCVRYTLSVIPRGKISLGIPAYGYDWDLTDKHESVQRDWKVMDALRVKAGAESHWDAASSSPWFEYLDSDHHRHVVWHENTRSLRLKSQLAQSEGLCGISIYALGMEDDAFWKALRFEAPKSSP
jgi:spore germination protein